MNKNFNENAITSQDTEFRAYLEDINAKDEVIAHILEDLKKITLEKEALKNKEVLTDEERARYLSLKTTILSLQNLKIETLNKNTLAAKESFKGNGFNWDNHDPEVRRQAGIDERQHKRAA